MYEGRKMTRFNSSKARDETCCWSSWSLALLCQIITIVPATLQAWFCLHPSNVEHMHPVQGFEANYMHYAFARALFSKHFPVLRFMSLLAPGAEVSRGDPAARPLFLRVWASEVGTYASLAESPTGLTCKEPKSLPVPARGGYSTRLPSHLQIQQVAKKLAEAAPAP